MRSEREQVCDADRYPHRRGEGDDLRFCVACGRRGVFIPFYSALKKFGSGRRNLHLIKEFNCNSWTDVLAKTYSLPEYWGRGLSMASGIKLALPEATVVLATQSSHFFGEGAGALFQTASKNQDITCVILDRQWKPPRRAEREEGGEWRGAVSLNPIALLILSGATFVAQVHSDRVEEASAVIDLALRHTGFSAVYVVTPPSPSHPESETAPSFVQGIEPVEEGAHFQDQAAALALATRGDGPLRTGIFYRIDRPISEERGAAKGIKGISSIAEWEQLLSRFKP